HFRLEGVAHDPARHALLEPRWDVVGAVQVVRDVVTRSLTEDVPGGVGHGEVVADDAAGLDVLRHACLSGPRGSASLVARRLVAGAFGLDKASGLPHVDGDRMD